MKPELHPFVIGLIIRIILIALIVLVVQKTSARYFDLSAPDGVMQMNIRRLKDIQETIAGDGVLLRELWNPKTQTDFGGRYSLAVAHLAPGKSSRPHSLATHEMYFILNGSGVMHIEEESEPVSSGYAIEIPPGSRQWLENVGSVTLTFLCLVDPGWRDEDETVL